MCCLTTAILQSYTVFANVQSKIFVHKRIEEKKRSMMLSIRTDGTQKEKEKQGATEGIGSCRNLHILSGGLFSSAALLLRSTSACVLKRSITVEKSLIHQHRLRSCLCVHPSKAARGPAENGGATKLHRVQMRGGRIKDKKKKRRKKKKNNRENRKKNKSGC